MSYLERTEEEKLKLAAEVIQYLNDMLAYDRDAVTQLIETRVPCNTYLDRAPTVQTAEVDGKIVVGPLGFLNGLVGVRGDGWGYITAVYDNDGKITHFQPTAPEPIVG